MTIDEAKKNGDVKVEETEVSVTGPDGKEHVRKFDMERATTYEGALALCEGRIGPKDKKGEAVTVLDLFNYGWDLNRRRAQRQALLAQIEGPEKAIEKGVKALIASGAFDNEADAKAFILAKRAEREAVTA